LQFEQWSDHSAGNHPKDNYQHLIDQATVVMTMGQMEPYLQIYLPDIRKSRVDIVDLASTSVIYEFKRYTTAYVAGSEVILESKYYEGMVFDRVDIMARIPFYGSIRLLRHRWLKIYVTG
jgi:hypothetical protein